MLLPANHQCCCNCQSRAVVARTRAASLRMSVLCATGKGQDDRLTGARGVNGRTRAAAWRGEEKGVMSSPRDCSWGRRILPDALYLRTVSASSESRGARVRLGRTAKGWEES